MRCSEDKLVVGLVNNMPAKAALAAERQFQALLSLASAKGGIRMRFISLPSCASRLNDDGSGDRGSGELETIEGHRLDGLIVTGTEPQAGAIVNEPIWLALSRLVDWAEHNTISTVWSCLAAHAVAYHLDGLSREKLPEKLSGVFQCSKAMDHYLTAGAPPRWEVPHSRHNDLNEEILLEKGYRILSRIPGVGADTVIKQSKSMFVLMQGHPEYGADSLCREYRRDIKRFLMGERDTYPEMPRNYFDETTAAALGELKELALRKKDLQLLSVFDRIVRMPSVSSWEGYAVGFYERWLTYLVQQKNAD
jgi:homoserine O-succinyltransferase/O-acetyltransferase